jgi:hypothetical protein
MHAEEAARLFKLWAADKGYVAKTKFSLDPEPQIAAADFGVLSGANEAALNAFHNRGVVFVGFNEEEHEVIVYTAKRLPKKERAFLPAAIEDVEIVYKQGGYGSAGGAPGMPFAGGPYTLHGGRYTCGSSVHPANILGSGTIACLVRDAQNVIYGLSNNHVTGGCSFGLPGTPILVPGPVDAAAGGLDPFTLGHHARCLPMVDGVPQMVNVSENSDAALFAIVNPDRISSMQRDLFDTPAAAGPITTGQNVVKVGRTSGLTKGVVEAKITGAEWVQYSVPAINGHKVVFFDSLYLVRGEGRMFAEPGDSGSLVIAVNDAGECTAVGIVTATNVQRQLAFVLPLGPILAQLGVTLISAHNA